MKKDVLEQILNEDYRTMARMSKILSFVEFGFSFFSHKKGFHVKKVASTYCLRDFDFVFPTLDAAIYYVEGYTQARHVTGEDDGTSSNGGNRKPYQPQFH